MGVSRMDKIRNEQTRAAANVNQLGGKVREAILKLFRHTLRGHEKHVGKNGMGMELQQEGNTEGQSEGIRTP